MGILDYYQDQRKLNSSQFVEFSRSERDGVIFSQLCVLSSSWPKKLWKLLSSISDAWFILHTQCCCLPCSLYFICGQSPYKLNTQTTVINTDCNNRDIPWCILTGLFRGARLAGSTGRSWIRGNCTIDFCCYNNSKWLTDSLSRPMRTSFVIRSTIYKHLHIVSI